MKYPVAPAASATCSGLSLPNRLTSFTNVPDNACSSSGLFSKRRPVNA
jgi:hypothetical protein